MTILSKKKSSQGKSEETPDQASHLGGPHSHAPLPNHSQSSESIVRDRLTSPTGWSSRDEKRSALCTSPRFDDYDHESGPSHSKRRHRTSPHRPTRGKLRDRSSASPSYSGSSNVGNSAPIAGPSRLVDDLEESGYNSGDEYGAPCVSGRRTEAEWDERDRWFEKTIRRKGFIIKKMEEDGACLFRAVADQVYGDQDMHTVVRNHCMDYIAANSDYFSHYVTEDFDHYVNRKRRDYVHGNHIEMQAMSEMYNRSVEVFCYGVEPINIFHGKHKTDNEPIRLSYQRGSHYNSIVDPYKATIGVGLGLPSYTPGLADKNLMQEAVSLSEDFHIEQTMLEDKLRATDWEATNEAIEEQIARESYLQWLRDNEKRSKTVRSPSETSSSATVTSAEIRSPRNRIPGSGPPSPTDLHHSPKHVDSDCYGESLEACSQSSSSSPGCSGNKNQCQGFELLETASFINRLSPQMFGLSDWEDAGIVAQVLATSQQEYLDSLKKGRDDSLTTNKDDTDVDDEQPSTSRH
ncbi:OTU domain-containing protein 5-A [Anabrus simplex]|uniref:OTU domain-containing protein 5-A n=1 Tax=Anabrus simplex TaxID=316456 RepID=UPI0034DD1542